MRIVHSLPDTDFTRPTEDEMRGLRAIVVAAHPWLSDHDERSFQRAFVAVGYQYRTAAPVSTRYFSGVIAGVNAVLELLDLNQVDGTAVMAAILAHGDVPWQRQDRTVGAMLEVGLCPTHGLRLPTPNAWRGLLDGTRNLLAPTPPRDRARFEPVPLRMWGTD